MSLYGIKARDKDYCGAGGVGGVRGPGGAGHNAGVQEPGIRTVVPRSVRGPLASKDPACVRLVRFTTCSAESFHVKIDL